MKANIGRNNPVRQLSTLFALSLMSQPLFAQPTQDLDEFSQVLLEYAYTVERAQSVPYHNTGPTEKILSMSDAELKALYAFMPDPDAFTRAAKIVIANGQAGLLAPQARETLDGPGLMKSHPAASGFAPDYPSGPSYDAFIATLPGLGLLDFGKTNRTDANGVGAAWITFHALQFTALAAQAVCDGALLGAPAACVAAGVANAAAMATQVVLDQTAYQDGLVDGAEIEAAYENTVILLGQQNNLATDLNAHSLSITNQLTQHDTDVANQITQHDTDIKNAVASHDADLKAALSTHDADVKALLANVQAGVNANGARLDLLLERQLEIIRLLHTPQGRRATQVPACDGGPCSWNP